MIRHAFLVPKVIATVSVLGVLLLILAFASRTDSKWDFGKLPGIGSRPGSDSSIEPHLFERLQLGEKIWGEAVQDRQEMLEESGPDRDFPDGYTRPYNVWDFARPSFFCPHDLERVGNLGDGGKVVCGMSRYEKHSPGPSSASNDAPELVVYSFGVNHDSSFEAALLERTNAEIWGYDFSVEGWGNEITEQYASRAHFNKAGIGMETDEKKSPPFYSVQDLMKANGHDYVDVVKMDIEGAEFDAMTSLVEHTIAEGAEALPFGQLLIEIHFFSDHNELHIPRKLKTWMDWWSSIENLGLRPVSNEDNYIGNEILRHPRFMEYTLINVRDARHNKLLW